METAAAPPALAAPHDRLDQILDDLESIAKLLGGIGLAQRDSQYEVEGETLRYLACGIRAARNMVSDLRPALVRTGS